MEEKDKKIVTLIIVVSLILAIVGGTFAYFRWQTSTEQETSVTFTVTSSFSCSADGGDISTNNISLAPTDCTNSQYAIKRKVTTNSIITAQDKTVYMDLWLDIETLDPELANTENFKWVFTKEENSCNTDNAVSYGTFEDLTDQDIVMLLDSKSYETTTQDDTYYLYIWLDKAETSPDTQNKNFEFKLNGECTDIGKNTLTGAAATLVANANSTDLMYADATEEQQGNMWTFVQAETEQVPATTDYRFIGASPNNWIKFNGDEDWRIIGVFDNKIKIIKSTKVGNDNYHFDNKKNGVGSSTSNYGSNDWTDSQLMYMLNTPIYKNSDGTYNTTLLSQELLKEGYILDGNYIKDNKTTQNIIYELGKVPAGIAIGGTSYSGDAMTWQLNATAISQIEKTTFYLGGTNVTANSASAWYNAERGISTPNNNTNPTSWTGYVGLMYPSDYAYTYAYGVDDTCFENTYSCTAELGEKSWLYKDVISASNYPWTISPYQYNSLNVFKVGSSNAVISNRDTDNVFGVHSSIYLKSGTLLSGKGTQEEPYRIIE